ncbi:hypothetical protein EYF80_049420 [Liparis tanakae]|uniref:Uncharacterized protein n=1 Tax=Liparis tanakae TaxID=230148 RepID=A0A4Z2FGT1_9TELE|nr:hypothetical protein EYF80_049420 [Liparis tanakae]
MRALRRNWRSEKRAVSLRATSCGGPSFSESRPQVRLTSILGSTMPITMIFFPGRMAPRMRPLNGTDCAHRNMLHKTCRPHLDEPAWDIFTPSGEEGEMQPNKSSGILLQVEAKGGDCMMSSRCLINKHIS